MGAGTAGPAPHPRPRWAAPGSPPVRAAAASGGARLRPLLSGDTAPARPQHSRRASTAWWGRPEHPKAKPVAPPLGLQGELGQQRIRPPFPQPSVPPLTEAAARRALLRFVAARRCYGSRAAAELVIRELRPHVTYRYRLETFSESRLSEWAFEPFTKPGASRPPGDIPPDLWDVEVGVPPLFQGQTRRCRVPRSALVRECHRCHGRGRSQCGACHGAGRARCVTCRGSRRRLKQQRCQLCSGTGRSRCSTCSGRGSKTCTTCQGEKKLRHFRQLVITWRNNVFEFVSEHHPNFPGELLSKVSGENIFKDENVVVYPIVDFPEPAISRASRRAIAEHSAAFASSSRILRQRQTVERIPITEVHYQYSGKPYLYYIYGLENKVYALDYPERCCCGCNIV
ncbi:protein SSUH2 homolog [Cygnus atratus]|uniref:protein SSUH2 homolog n=1 Tax=Cygnus atratus TaxID=8868 RepID=UPI0021B73012|nr:protein SSUH2 homolog [Cygnus atratus]